MRRTSPSPRFLTEVPISVLLSFFLVMIIIIISIRRIINIVFFSIRIMIHIIMLQGRVTSSKNANDSREAGPTGAGLLRFSFRTL